MIESKYPPGPWRVIQGEHGAWVALGESDHDDIVIIQSLGMSQEEINATKRLIAMAPEMLDMLQGILDAVKSNGSLDVYLVDKIKDLLDKSKGTNQ